MNIAAVILRGSCHDVMNALTRVNRAVRDPKTARPLFSGECWFTARSRSANDARGQLLILYNAMVCSVYAFDAKRAVCIDN